MSSEGLERERSIIMDGLGSADDEMRRLSVERLLALPAADAIPRLVESLGDSSWRVRKAAVSQLAACNETDLVDDALIAAMADGENPGRRNSAVEALVGAGERMVPRLVAELESDDVDVRKLVVDAIAGIGGGAGRRAMIATLGDADPNVRAAAADALGAIAGEGVDEALLKCGTDDSEDQLVRYSALRALVNLEARVRVDDLSGVLDDPILCTAGYSLLGHVEEDDPVPSLLKGLVSNSRASREASMESLLRVLSRFDGGEADTLMEQIREAALASDTLIGNSVERLPDADLGTRLVLVQFLGLVGARESVVAILEAAQDEAIAEVALETLVSLGALAEDAVDEVWDRIGDPLRQLACRFLARTEGERGEARMLESLESPDAQVRSLAAGGLGMRRSIVALEGLVRRLEISAMDDDFEVEEERAAVIEALVTLARPRDGSDTSHVEITIEHLSSRLDGAEEDVRLAIATVLGRIGRREDQELVTSLLKDPDDRVRRAAVEALVRLDPGAGSEPLRLALADESAVVRTAGAAALAASTAVGVMDDLEGLVGDEDWRVRAATMRAIGVQCTESSDPEVRGRALRLIERGLADEGAVAVAAVEGLEFVGGEGAANLALGLIGRSEPEVVQAAVSCVGAHGDLESLLELLPLVSHSNWTVRAEVIQTLADRRVGQALPPILRRLETEQDSFVREMILRGLKKLED